jgi:2-keto-4-pentenoate hydratase/2-oxohepta-3-ene-1,7-dioic acid hydratase in catechol pathway
MNRGSYKTLKNTWQTFNITENYESKITMSYPDWINYVSSGRNALLEGGVIPSGTVQTAGGNSGAVYKGPVRQGY